MTEPVPQRPDYAVPAALPPSRDEPPAGPSDDGLWGGRGRTSLKVGAWVAAALLALPVVVPLLAPSPTGAASPEAAVEQLLNGVADLDPVAIVGAIDPDETDDPARAEAAYDRLSGGLLRLGEVPSLDVTAVLLAAEAQLGGDVDTSAVATLAALDLDLDGLRTTPGEETPLGTRVHVEAGDLAVRVDPERLPGDVAGIGRASYTMPLAEGWLAGGVPLERPSLVAVEHDGRWYVSLEASADDLLGSAG
ncbi:hypothetical protein ABFT23_04290 [Nocardioides sp. C4-1]|uniref:hypothetical protein n=1 Tax=Nocardioides sp. C4-1 TaxID=3151851 RepID=UPI003264E7C0